MIGTATALLALVMIPLGFVLAILMLRALDHRQRDHDDSGDRGVARHPSQLAALPLDDAPADVIAEVARRAGPSSG